MINNIQIINIFVDFSILDLCILNVFCIFICINFNSFFKDFFHVIFLCMYVCMYVCMYRL